MASVCIYFQVHQPFRLRRYSVFDTDRHYFDDHKNAEILRKVASKCYLPANQLLLDAIRQHEGRFKIAFSLSGVILEQFEQYAPEVLDTFRALAQTNCVEFLEETYFHSLAFFVYHVKKFRLAGRECIAKPQSNCFSDQEPRVFRNTELIYNNDLAHFVSHMGYDGILAEGADQILGTRSPNYVYRPPHSSRVKLLLKNYRLSDDIAFRFSNRNWEQWPCNAAKFATWVNQINGHGTLCNLFMDYETIGEHQWAENGDFRFHQANCSGEVMKASQREQFRHAQRSYRPQRARRRDRRAEHDLLGRHRALAIFSAWLGNAIQSNALHELYKLEGPLKEKGDELLLTDWRKLMSSDHFICFARNTGPTATGTSISGRMSPPTGAPPPL